MSAAGACRYYFGAGAGGLAVGVHATQFAIRDVGLYAPVLEVAMRTAAEWARTPPVMIARLAGRAEQAVREAQNRPGSQLSRRPRNPRFTATDHLRAK